MCGDIFRYLLLAALSLGLASCAGNSVREYTQASDVKQLTEDEERRWYQADELDKVLRHRGVLYEDPAVREYAQSVMDRLFPEFEGTIRVSIAKSSQLNAYALPNGSVYINLGLIARMQNEAQLAMVLGHEAAHFIEQHSLKQRKAADGIVIAGVALTVVSGIPMSGQLMIGGAMSGYSQNFERAADQLGFERFSDAGYDPEQAAEVFNIMREEVKALKIKRPFLYSSHPKLSERVETLTTLARDHDQDGGEAFVDRFERQVGHLRARLLEQYLVEHDYERLILILENGQRRAGYPRHAGYYLGEAYRLRDEEGDSEKAMEAYRQSMRVVPEFADNYRAIGLAMMKSGDAPEAVRYLEDYLRLVPDAEDRKYIQRYLAKLKD